MQQLKRIWKHLWYRERIIGLWLFLSTSLHIHSRGNLPLTGNGSWYSYYQILCVVLGLYMLFIVEINGLIRKVRNHKNSVSMQ